jgi:hypothetical protein
MKLLSLLLLSKCQSNEKIVWIGADVDRLLDSDRLSLHLAS